MNWSVLLITAVISGIVLWLGAKFFGKKGFIMVALLEVAVSLTVAYSSGSAILFNVLVPAIIIPLLTILFVIFLFYKKYAFKDVTKLLIITGSALLFVGITNTLYYVYLMSFAFAWDIAMVPMLIVLATLFGAVFTGYLVDIYANFIKDTNYRNIFALLCAILVGSIIFIIFTLVGQVSFGSLLLSIFMSFLVSVLFIAALLILDKVGLFASKDEVKKIFGNKKNHLSDKIIFDQIKQDKAKTDKSKKDNSTKFKNEIEIEDWEDDDK